LTAGTLGAAAGNLERAIRLSPEGSDGDDLRRQLLEVLVAAGRFQEASTLAKELLVRSSAPDRPAVHLLLAEAAAQRHDWDTAGAELQLATSADHAGETENSSGTAAVRFRLVEADLAAGDYDGEKASRLAGEALDAARRASDGRILAAALISAARLTVPFSPESARNMLLEALGLAAGPSLSRQRALALASLAELEVLAVGERSRCEEALAAANQAGAVGLAAAATHNLAMLAALHFDLANASSWADECIALARRYRLGWLEAAGITKRAFVAALKARSDECDRLLELAEAAAGGDPRGLSLMDGNVRAAAALNQEDIQGALDHLARACQRALEHRLEPRPYLGLHALVLAATGKDPEPAAALLEERGLDWPPVIRGLVRAGRAISVGRADYAAAEELADRAWPQLAATPWHEMTARRLVGAAQVEAGWGDPVATVAPAETWYAEGGLSAPRDACRALLRRAGRPVASRSRPPAGVPGQLASLGVTGREAEVLELVSCGFTNRQIAERLFLSVRTVDKHVERLMIKTGRPNRAALAALAASSGANT
jgi:DNA-binding CsgD family transcriptional regulator